MQSVRRYLPVFIQYFVNLPIEHREWPERLAYVYDIIVVPKYDIYMFLSIILGTVPLQTQRVF